jgi:uncharacterized membrane protein
MMVMFMVVMMVVTVIVRLVGHQVLHLPCIHHRTAPQVNPHRRS